MVAYLSGSGPVRTYANLSIPEDPREDMAWGFPKRPLPGSAADLDMLLQECDFGKGMVSVAHDLTVDQL